MPMQGEAIDFDGYARTQEIHMISSHTNRQAYAKTQNQAYSGQPSASFEPMTFSNTPFPTGDKGSARNRGMHDAHRRPRWRYAFVSCMVVLDIAVMLLSLLISLLVNGEAYVTIVRSMPFELFLFCFSLIWVLCLALAGTYHRHLMADGYELYAKIINASLLTVLLYCSLSFTLNLDLPRTALITAPVIAFFLAVIERWQMRMSLHRNRRNGRCKYKTVLVGSSAGINAALRTMADYSNWGYEPIAVCPIEADLHEPDAYVVTSFIPNPNIPGADKLKVIPFNSAFPRTCESLGVRRCT